MAESSTSTLEKSQYHHFIPRFILRNYSHPSDLPNGSRKSKKRGKRNNGPRSAEPMLSGINLAGEEVEITETTVAKTFGMMDMYRDLGKSTKQHEVEEQLSVLESRAGEIISTIRKAFEAGKTDVWITRTQRDTLRKFLFIMKYRGCRFHKRYFHENADAYDENDKERMLKYMKEKGIKKPIDVWFDNIKGILDLKMDYGMEWMEKLEKRIYPDDAKWFINNTQQFYLALCTTSATEDEFLLTQNAYSVYEGATTESRDSLSRKTMPEVYTEFHVFAPIAPKLMIVLRTFILPVPSEDSDDAMREQREMWYQANVSQHAHPEAAGSMLRHLPIEKARNSYSKVVDGKIEPINGGPTGPNDKFCFRFFSIPQEYVNKINGIMLNESYQIDMIVFNNKANACRILENYLEHSMEFGIESERLWNLKKLRQAANLLRAVLPEQETPKPQPKTIQGLEIPEDKLYKLFCQKEKFQKLYFEISGKTILDSKDFDQARGLLYMRIKLDSSTRGFPEAKREEARNDFLKLYNDFPVQVVWIYLKRIRFMKQGGTMIGSGNFLEDYDLPAMYLDGLEDVVASSRDLFQKKDLCRVMHHASFNGALLAKPGWGLIGELTLDDDGMRRLHEEKELVLGTQGSICDCGITDLEELAKATREMIRSERLYEKSKSPFDKIFFEDEKIELTTRLLVRSMKGSGVGKWKIQNPELEKVIFEVVYPLFGFRQGRRTDKGGSAEEGSVCSVQ